MSDPRCTCGPSILDPECPVEEHRRELERVRTPMEHQQRAEQVAEIRLWVETDEPSRFIPPTLSELPPMESPPNPCPHWKVYSGEYFSGLDPKYVWICENCGQQSFDRFPAGQAPPIDRERFAAVLRPWEGQRMRMADAGNPRMEDASKPWKQTR